MLCENVLVLIILKYFNIAMTILKFIIPIILIVKTVLDIYHQIIDVNDKSFKDKLTKRVAASIMIFLVPTIINVFLSLLEVITNMSFNYSECMVNIKNIEYYSNAKMEERQKEFEANLEKYEQNYKEGLEKLKIEVANNLNSVSNPEQSISIGKKYNLSDAQITNIAKVCQMEQGTAEGAAAEAELMINKYILSGSSSNLYDYIFIEAKGWWYPIKYNKYPGVSLNSSVKEAVRKVVNEGQRTLPTYINEHDCMDCNKNQICSNGNRGDICSITTNGTKYTSMSAIKNRSNYVSGVTRLRTVHGGNWTFYSFPTSKSDPFGYTDEAKAKIDQMSR